TAADEHCELRDQLYLHPADTNLSKLWGCGGSYIGRVIGCSLAPHSPSLPRKAEHGDRGIAAANFRSDQVVYAYDARDDRHVLPTAGAVRDYSTTGRPTQVAPQQHLAESGIQRQQVAGYFTGEYQIARGRRNAGYHRSRRFV